LRLNVRTLACLGAFRWRATPEPPCSPTKDQGEDWKGDGADARTTSTRAEPREEGRHYEQTNGIEDPERTYEGRNASKNSTHALPPEEVRMPPIRRTLRKIV